MPDDKRRHREPRGPRHFDPSLNHSEAWYPPRPPDDDTDGGGAPADSSKPEEDEAAPAEGE